MPEPSADRCLITTYAGLPPGAKQLSQMGAEEITETLRRHFTAVGALVCATELELGRELVRRARRIDELEARVRELTFLLWKRDQG